MIAAVTPPPDQLRDPVVVQVCRQARGGIKETTNPAHSTCMPSLWVAQSRGDSSVKLRPEAGSGQQTSLDSRLVYRPLGTAARESQRGESRCGCSKPTESLDRCHGVLGLDPPHPRGFVVHPNRTVRQGVTAKQPGGASARAASREQRLLATTTRGRCRRAPVSRALTRTACP